MPSPLQGTLVVDLSRHLPGPLAGRLLAGLGARVVKVEEPSLGDTIRTSPPVREGVGALGAILLAGVESLALDLKDSGAKGVLERLLARADVLLESFRPGTLARLGLPPEELRRRFPGLVICSLTGWGQSGPYAARAGHDLTYQAAAGTLAATAAMPALPVADLIGGWSAVTALPAALLGRVDVPAEPVLSAAEARSHPQAIERALLSTGPDRLPRLAFPARFDGERPAPGGSAPDLGEHTSPILVELGVPREIETSPGVG